MENSVGCSRCTYADAYGRGCKHGLMFPVLLLMGNMPCPNFERKTTEQIEEQLRILENESKNQKTQA